MKNTLRVFEPTEKFCEFVKANFPRHWLEKSLSGRPKLLIVFDYKPGSYKGVIGQAATFRNKPI